MGERSRAEILLDTIHDDVSQRLNPDNEDCWHCGGEGATYDCIDGCCLDAESGCPDCARPCLECRLHSARHAKAVREDVIELGDIDVAKAWLKSIDRWTDDITDERVRAELDQAKAALRARASGVPVGEEKDEH